MNNLLRVFLLIAFSVSSAHPYTATEMRILSRAKYLWGATSCLIVGGLTYHFRLGESLAHKKVDELDKKIGNLRYDHWSNIESKEETVDKQLAQLKEQQRQEKEKAVLMAIVASAA